MLEGTKFGIYLRKLRRENGDSLRTMANKLGITPAFISSLEIGKKKIPLDYIDKIAELYNLSEEEKLELTDCVYESNNKIVIELEELSDEQIDLSLAFARKLKSNDKEFLESIRQFLDENKD